MGIIEKLAGGVGKGKCEKKKAVFSKDLLFG